MNPFAIHASWLLAAVLALSACSSQPKTRRLADAPPVPMSANDPVAVYVDLATNYLRQGQPEAALVNAEKALAMDPSRQEIHIIQALAQSSLGYFDQAEANLQKVLTASPGNPFAANALGTILCSRGRYPEAVAQFDAAARSPNNATPWVALTNSALCAVDRGTATEATSRFQQALQANPRFGPALLGLARLSQAAGDNAQARGYINRYFEVTSPDAGALWLAYRIESALGNRQGAETYASILRDRFPESIQTMRLVEP